MRLSVPSTLRSVAIGAALVLVASGVALAQMHPVQQTAAQHQEMAPMAGGQAGMRGPATTPTMPGQDAFGAIQEIVHILEADPTTDWSKVDLETLRQHLIDMNEVTLKAEAAARQIDNGSEVKVTGHGRALVAIKPSSG
jgi:antitoxin (DNA-binding transcriptional repressor) of toxin-antitoxin stability system